MIPTWLLTRRLHSFGNSATHSPQYVHWFPPTSCTGILMQCGIISTAPQEKPQGCHPIKLLLAEGMYCILCIITPIAPFIHTRNVLHRNVQSKQVAATIVCESVHPPTAIRNRKKSYRTHLVFKQYFAHRTVPVTGTIYQLLPLRTNLYGNHSVAEGHKIKCLPRKQQSIVLPSCLCNRLSMHIFSEHSVGKLRCLYSGVDKQPYIALPLVKTHGRHKCPL